MAIIDMVPFIQGCQFTGSNSAELVTFAGGIAITSFGIGYTASLNAGSSGTTCIIDIKDPGGSLVYQPVLAINDYMINNNGGFAGGSPIAIDPQYRTIGALLAASRTITNSVSRSIVTGTGATGFQLSATRTAQVEYSVSLSTTATIGGAATATVALEAAPTNSATSGDWIELARASNSQTITLAVALQSVQVVACNLKAFVPAGWWCKLRSITTGTASASYVSGQEVLV